MSSQKQALYPSPDASAPVSAPTASFEPYLPHAAQIELIASLTARKLLPRKPLIPYQLFVSELKTARAKAASATDQKAPASIINTEAAAKWEKFTPEEKQVLTPPHPHHLLRCRRSLCDVWWWCD